MNHQLENAGRVESVSECLKLFRAQIEAKKVLEEEEEMKKKVETIVIDSNEETPEETRFAEDRRQKHCGARKSYSEPQWHSHLSSPDWPLPSFEVQQ